VYDKISVVELIYKNEIKKKVYVCLIFYFFKENDMVKLEDKNDKL
jgi:hypothetical protein